MLKNNHMFQNKFWFGMTKIAITFLSHNFLIMQLPVLNILCR